MTAFIKWTLAVLTVLLVINLGLSLFDINNPVMNFINGGTEFDTTKPIELWGVRGQIGDILSGHFSAIAVFAIAYSIILQVEANKQMRESIDKQEESLRQQSEALAVQSRSLEAQIEELKASREESERQTDEFFIQSINMKLDRYYSLLDNACLEVTENDIAKAESKKQKDNLVFRINNILMTYTLLEDEVLRFKDDEKYHRFYDEFKTRINTQLILFRLIDTNGIKHLFTENQFITVRESLSERLNNKS